MKIHVFMQTLLICSNRWFANNFQACAHICTLCERWNVSFKWLNVPNCDILKIIFVKFLFQCRSTVRLGAFDINLKNDDKIQDVKVQRFIRHPDYNETNRLNDLAILQLERDVEFTGKKEFTLQSNCEVIIFIFYSNFYFIERIRPVCLPLREPIRSQNFIDYTPFIAAWLRNAPANKSAINGNANNVMRDWQLTVIDNKECRKQYKARSKTILNNKFDNSVMCADNIDAGQAECQSDAGLMQPIFNPKVRSFPFYQTGILSHGIGCKSNGMPVVYTRVQHYIDWIEKNIQQ